MATAFLQDDTPNLYPAWLEVQIRNGLKEKLMEAAEAVVDEIVDEAMVTLNKVPSQLTGGSGAALNFALERTSWPKVKIERYENQSRGELIVTVITSRGVK